MVTAFQTVGGAQMTPVVLKMETIQQKAQYQISNMVLARKNREKGTGTASNAYKAHTYTTYNYNA